VKVTKRFKDDFFTVMEAFRTSPEEVGECKRLVAADYESAEATIHATACLIRAGWKPLREQAATFIRRTRAEA
jgi:hypothetical protein